MCVCVNIRICLKHRQPLKIGRYTKGHSRSSKYNQCIITINHQQLSKKYPKIAHTLMIS